MQKLLRERVPIRDLETILETLGDWAPRTKDTDVLTEYARHALARTICQLYKDEHNVIRVVTLDPKLEDLISGHLERSDRGTFLSLSPEMQNRLVAAVRSRLEASAGDGRRADGGGALFAAGAHVGAAAHRGGRCRMCPCSLTTKLSVESRFVLWDWWCLVNWRLKTRDWKPEITEQWFISDSVSQIPVSGFQVF